MLERSNRGIELTDAGKVLFKYSAQMIKLYDSFREEIDNLRNNCGTFRIAASSVVGNYAIPCTMFRMQSKFDGFTFSLSSMPSNEVIANVIEGQADVGFIVGGCNEPGITCKKSFSDKIFLVAAEDYRVAEKIDVDDLKKYPLVMLNEKFSSYRMLLSQLKHMGHNINEFKVLYNLDSTESVKSSVIGRYGMAFLPYMAIKKEVYLKQLKMIEVDGVNLSYDVYMIYKTGSFSNEQPIGAVHKYLEKNVSSSMC